MPVTEKYINKIIMADSPYLGKGVIIKKRYLNPYYIDPEPKLQLPPLRQPKYLSGAFDIQVPDKEASSDKTEKILLLKPKRVEANDMTATTS